MSSRTTALDDTTPVPELREDRGSVAGLSMEVPTPVTSRSELSGERYQEVAVVGEGGLGTVLRAHDRYLRRDVALKRIGPRARSPGEQAHDRFLREARITARLDHPNIVPVHDAGTTSDGRIYYTMRLIRGRSLAEVAASRSTLDERLALVGGLTAACHAVGHAHRRGIIHRDLKPANIMIGDEGETQVVDWGLAEALDEPVDHAGFAGTLPYASPELFGGARATIASDVWALGVTLHEVVAGVHRFTGGRETLEAELTRAEPTAAIWPPGCPPELAAIGDRAMATAPHDRYPDAHAMALDLEAFREGRRVAAHRYSSFELARRFVRAWRWPLAALATLVLGTISAFALTAHRTEGQRQRAVTAEAATRAQLEQTETALAESLAAEAVSFLGEHAPAAAEHAAVAALRLREHIDARGVLAVLHAAPRPTLLAHFVPPECTHVAAVTADSALCLGAAETSAWEVGTARRRWTQPIELAGAVALASGLVVAWDDRGKVRTLDGATGRERASSTVLVRVIAANRAPDGERAVLHDGLALITVESEGTLLVSEHPCGDETIAAAATSATETYVVCANGELREVAPDEVRIIVATGFGTEISAATALGVSFDGLDVAIGSTAGDLALRDHRGCFSPDCGTEPRTTMLAFEQRAAIRRIVSLGSSVIAVADHGDGVVVRRGAAGESTRIPVEVADDVVALEGGELVTGGAAWRRWQITDQPPAALHVYRGLVAGSVSDDRRTAAALTDDGLLVVWSVQDGVLRLELDVGDAHAVSLDATGTEATVRLVDRLDRYTIATGVRVDQRPVDSASPRAAPSARADDGRVQADGVRSTVDVVVGGTRHSLAVVGATVESLALSPDAAWLAVGTSRGRIDMWRLGDAAPELRARIPAHTERVTWLAFVGDTLWSTGADRVMTRADLRVLDTAVPSLEAAALATWGPPGARD